MPARRRPVSGFFEPFLNFSRFHAGAGPVVDGPAAVATLLVIHRSSIGIPMRSSQPHPRCQDHFFQCGVVQRWMRRRSRICGVRRAAAAAIFMMLRPPQPAADGLRLRRPAGPHVRRCGPHGMPQPQLILVCCGGRSSPQRLFAASRSGAAITSGRLTVF